MSENYDDENFDDDYDDDDDDSDDISHHLAPVVPGSQVFIFLR